MADNKPIVVAQKSGKGVKSTATTTISVQGIPEETYVVGLWKNNQIVGHTNVSRGAANPEFSTKFILDSFSEDATELKFCVYKVQPKNTVNEDCFVGCAIIKLTDLVKDAKLAAPLEGATGATLNFNAKVAAAKVKKEKKAQPKDDKPKVSKEQEKANKAALKEGGKKGQDLCGMSTFGVHHFMPAMDIPNGNWDLLELCMQGMNKEIDPEADDRKGGAGDLGKILFSAGPDKLLMYCHLPKEVNEQCSMKEWMDAIMKPVDGKVIEESEFFMKAEAAGNPDDGKFPLKMRDEAIGAGFLFLRQKGLILDDDDSDDDINFADDCGIDLNAGAEGDY